MDTPFIHGLAAQVANQVADSRQAVDPILIITIAEIIIELIKLVHDCRKPAQEIFASPSIIAKWRLRQVVRSKPVPFGTTYRALLDLGASLTEQECQQLMA